MNIIKCTQRIVELGANSRTNGHIYQVYCTLDYCFPIGQRSSLAVSGRNLQVVSGSKIGPKCFKSVAKLINEISHEYHQQKQN